MMFENRQEAGRILARKLRAWGGPGTVVLALPRGGVPVAAAVARALAVPLDLILVRKIGAPGQEEFAIGAIAEGGEVMTDPELIAALKVDATYLESAKTRALAEIARRRRAYLGNRPAVALRGKTAIVVDDGIATGATMAASLRTVRARGPARIILAVPVAAPEAIARLRAEVDEVVCLDIPAQLRAVGFYYRDFAQLADTEVIAALAANAADISRRH